MRLWITACVLGCCLSTLTAGIVDIVIDNDDGAPAYTETGAWTTSLLTGHDGGTYRTVAAPGPSASATWQFSLAYPATLEVAALFRSGTNRTSSARHVITHAAGSTEVFIDQTGSGELTERFLGTHAFGSGTWSITIDNSGGAGYHIADAIRLSEPVNDPPTVSALSLSPGLPPAGVPFSVSAEISDPDSAIASAEVRWLATPGNASGFVIARDDGLSHDGGGGDGVFGATLPAQASLESLKVVMIASDAEGLTGLSPTAEVLIGILGDATALSFVIAGQSNASGRGELDENTEAPDARVVMFANDYRWKTAFEPVDDATDQIDLVSSELAIYAFNPRHSFGLRAGKDLVAAGTSSVRLIPCPLGATAISEWRRGADPLDRSTLFGSMNHRRVIAAPDGLTAVLWWQGESNQGNPSAYLTGHQGFIQEMREEMGSELPLIMVQLARRIPRGDGQQAIAEIQRSMETGSGSSLAISNHHLVVAFDQAMYDNNHIDAAGQREVGRRLALAVREHILGHTVDGTGPRLRQSYPLVHPGGDPGVIAVRFDRPIAPPSNAYDDLFRAYDDGLPVPIASAVRDAADSSAVLLTLSSPVIGQATVTYGDVTGSALITDPVRGMTGLPTPRFGPLDAEVESVPTGLSLIEMDGS